MHRFELVFREWSERRKRTLQSSARDLPHSGRGAGGRLVGLAVTAALSFGSRHNCVRCLAQSYYLTKRPNYVQGKTALVGETTLLVSSCSIVIAGFQFVITPLGSVVKPVGIAYMDVGKAREHMYKKYGIRTTQEQLSRSGSLRVRQAIGLLQTVFSTERLKPLPHIAFGHISSALVKYAG